MVKSKWNDLPDGAAHSASLLSLCLNDDGLDKKTKEWHYLLTAFVCLQFFFFQLVVEPHTKSFPFFLPLRVY